MEWDFKYSKLLEKIVEFDEGDLVTYKSSDRGKLPAKILKIGKRRILIRLENDKESYVSPFKLEPQKEKL